MSIQFLRSNTSDKKKIVGLFKKYGFALQEESWWDWKYRDNPHGQAISFKILSDSEMVGAVAIMPQLFHHGDRKIIGLQTVDGLMGKEIRGKRLFNDVMGFLLKNRPDGVDVDFFYLSFPSLQASIRAHENAGWSRLADGLIFSFPLQPSSVFRSKKWKFPHFLLSPFFYMYRKILVGKHRGILDICEISKFEQNMIPVLGDNTIRGDRSPEMLNWRVFDNPRDEMKAFTINEGAKCIGYFVCKVLGRNLEIVEARFEVPRPEFLLLFLKNIVEKKLADSVDLLVFGNHPNLALLPQWGYFRRPFSGVVFTQNAHLAGLPEGPKGWEISYLDSDW